MNTPSPSSVLVGLPISSRPSAYNAKEDGCEGNTMALFRAKPAMQTKPYPSFFALSLGIVLIGSLGLFGCEQTSSPTPPPVDKAPTNPAPTETSPPMSQTSPQPGPKEETPAPIAPKPKAKTASYPSQGAIVDLVNGDLMCYATIQTTKGKTEDVGTSFEICDQKARYLHQPVKFSYGKETVNDCESNEPCGKTKAMMLLTKVDFVGTPPTTMTNDTWTITIGNTDSWDGTNNTGDWTYYGCDNQDNCLALTGGTVTCRDGFCSSTWSHGDHRYILRSPMSERSNTGEDVLIVMQGEKELMTARGFRDVTP